MSTQAIEENAAQTQDEPPVKKAPVILVLILALLTLGLYVPFWFLARREQLNALNSERKLGSKGMFVFVLLLLLVSTFYSFSTDDAVAGFGTMLGYLCGIYLLLQTFRVRKILKDHFNAHLGRNIYFSWLTTLFLNIYYLQYKINRLQ